MPDTDIFRREALEHHNRSPVEGAPLHVVPHFARWTYRLLLALLCAALLFVVFATVDDFAEGPALIRADERVIMTAPFSGGIADVLATPGARVRKDAVLVRYRATQELAELRAITTQFNAALVKMLTDLSDFQARLDVGRLRAERDLLASRVGQFVIRAPFDGFTGEIRIRSGQQVAPGDMLLSVAPGDSKYSVVAFLPGARRPALALGQTGRLELAGFPNTFLDTSVVAIDSDFIGPSEIRRVLGPAHADLVSLTGPSVLVHAQLQTRDFVSDHTVYSYFDGMPATLRVRTGTQRLLTALVPGLKRLLAP